MKNIGLILLLGFMALICTEKVWSIVKYEDLDSPLRPRLSVIVKESVAESSQSRWTLSYSVS